MEINNEKKKKSVLHVGWATAQLYCKEGLLCCNTISVLQVGKAGLS